MGKKIQIVKKIIGLTIACSLILPVLNQGTQIKVQAISSDTISGQNSLWADNKLIKPTKFKTFNEYVDYLKKLNLSSGDNILYETNVKSIDSPLKNPSSDNISPIIQNNDANMTNSEFGTTNLQVVGVDESDIVKNDGKYIYVLNINNNSIKIINTNPVDDMSIEGEINLPSSSNNDYRNYNEIYICGDKLVVIYSYGTYRNYDDVIPLKRDSSKMMPNYYYRYNKSFVCADIYNISDRKSPKLVRSIMNEGNLNSSRMVGNTLYLIANKYINLYADGNINPYTKENLLVSYSDSIVSKDIKQAPVSSMYCILDKINPQNMQNLSIVSSVDISKDVEVAINSFTGTGYNIYMSLNSLYIFGQSLDSYTNYTDIYKYKIDGTSVKFVSANKALGYMLNQFCADEFDGNLRLATTDWNLGNNIFVFDKDMKKVGQIASLAKGEQIKSCRFIGDKGYVVTYRTVDPLFILDLSKPYNPIVTAELKIPGFSSYLHPVSDNLIIGIGESTTPVYWRDENGNEIEAGIKQIGVKISLFDVSNPSKPVELKAITVGGPGSYTDVGYDHKAFTMIKDKNLIAIRGTFTSKPVNALEPYNYKSNTLNVEKIFDGHYSYGTANRITYINDTLYHFTGFDMVAYKFNNYQRLGSIQYN